MKMIASPPPKWTSSASGARPIIRVLFAGKNIASDMRMRSLCAFFLYTTTSSPYFLRDRTQVLCDVFARDFQKPNFHIASLRQRERESGGQTLCPNEAALTVPIRVLYVGKK